MTYEDRTQYLLDDPCNMRLGDIVMDSILPQPMLPCEPVHDLLLKFFRTHRRALLTVNRFAGRNLIKPMYWACCPF